MKDLADAKITAQLNTFHYGLIDQIPNVNKQQAMDNFSAMRTALASGMIDGYVSERPEGITATSVNKELKMLEFPKENGFDASAEDSQVAVGMRKGDPDIEKVNKILAGISQDERTKIMDQAIKDQPAATDSDEQKTGLINDFKNIWNQYGDMFLRGAGLTLFIALIGTVVGTTLGLLIGVFRTIPDSENPVARFFQKLGNLILSIYIEVFRGTPMMVQAMVIFYGLALAFGISLDRTVAALFIVSVNTGAYMSEIVRGGIFAVDKGQFEAAQAIGMTHGQTMRKVVIPQVLRNILPATGNEFVINIKDTAVLSVIGVADLFFQGNAASGANFQFFQTFTIVGIMYLVMTFVITRILRVVERKMDGPSAYVKVEELTEEGKRKLGGKQMSAIIEIEHLRKSFGENEVLKDINMNVNKGEVVTIIGSSGSGKSTLLRCINLLEKPTDGKIIYNGKNVLERGYSLPKYRTHLGMVFQSFNLFNNMNVLENCTSGQMTVLKKQRRSQKLP